VLFSQIAHGDETLRAKCIAFVSTQVIANAAELLHPHPDVEEFLRDQILTVLNDVTGHEFRVFMNMLMSLKIFQTNEAAQELVNIIADQSGLNEPFKVCV